MSPPCEFGTLSTGGVSPDSSRRAPERWRRPSSSSALPLSSPAPPSCTSPSSAGERSCPSPTDAGGPRWLPSFSPGTSSPPSPEAWPAQPPTSSSSGTPAALRRPAAFSPSPWPSPFPSASQPFLPSSDGPPPSGPLSRSSTGRAEHVSFLPRPSSPRAFP